MSKRYPITMMCAVCIPWKEDLTLDEPMLREQVRFFIDQQVKSLYIFGTAGEGYAVNTATFTRVVEVFLDECHKVPDVMPMVGVISTSMMEIMDRIQIATKLGCRDFQIALPSWGGLSDQEVIDYFSMICNKFPENRFIHYNNGNRTKKLCKINLYLKLAKLFPNLVAVKYSTPNVYEIYDIVTADCPITFYLVDAGYTYGAMIGECGLLNSFASIDMELSWKYFYAGQNKDLTALTHLGRYHHELVKSFNVVEGELIDSAYDKTIERVANLNFSNKLYPPYQGLTEQEFESVHRAMVAVKNKFRGN